MPGIEHIMQFFRQRNFKIGLASSSPMELINVVSQKLGIGKYLNASVSAEHLPYGKPHPQVYEAALASVAVPAKAAWMVGDNLEWDVAAPQRLGILGIWIDRRGRGVPADSTVRPDRVIRSVEEI